MGWQPNIFAVLKVHNLSSLVACEMEGAVCVDALVCQQVRAFLTARQLLMLSIPQPLATFGPRWRSAIG
ncbi:hypothetical protein BDV93DRAFT_525808 [Ceratobasidium sp. AG-I]|nr:hypothetical protein BDV93DRAFT_525808 [Ceratobasidium sp. AG-I]